MARARAKKTNTEAYLTMYRQMVRIRAFEDQANQLYLSAKMPGLYVHEAVAEDFTDRLVAAMGALKVGNGLAEGVDVGPLVNASTRDKVAAFVEDAAAKGAKLRLGGRAPTPACSTRPP